MSTPPEMSALQGKIDASAAARRKFFCQALLVFVIFVLQGAEPIPATNEANYIGMARHFWNSGWCARDFYFQSAEAHAVFYACFGWPTLFLSNYWVAFFGRALTWALLAGSWVWLARAINPRTAVVVLSGAVFAVVAERGDLAGEWIIGGFEAKGIAYAAGLAGVAAVLRERWNLGFLFLGTATALHIVVGGWLTLLVGVLLLVDLACGGNALRPSKSAFPKVGVFLPGALGGAALAILGNLTFLREMGQGEPDVVAQAAAIQVFDRLPHHLHLWGIAPKMFFAHAMVVFAWLLLLPLGIRSRRLARFQVIAMGSMGLTLIGTFLTMWFAFEPLTKALWLRFYWFRMEDILLPAAIALSVGPLRDVLVEPGLTTRLRVNRLVSGWVLVVIAGLTAWGLGDRQLTMWRPWLPAPLAQWGQYEPRRQLGLEKEKYWQEACVWISQNTPVDALFLTPRSSQTFTWYANRGEVINRKNMPQDPAMVVEWRKRMSLFHGPKGVFANKSTLGELGAERLRTLGQEYGFDYIVTEVTPKLSLPLLYANQDYAVYLVKPTAPRD